MNKLSNAFCVDQLGIWTVRPAKKPTTHNVKVKIVHHKIIDGSPGIGCPIIASLTAADCALIVAEPTVSGLHDFERIADLTRKLSIPAFVCINKFDINQAVSNKIEECALNKGIRPCGVIRYDRTVTDAQRQRKAVTEYTTNGATQDISLIWSIVSGK